MTPTAARTTASASDSTRGRRPGPPPSRTTSTSATPSAASSAPPTPRRAHPVLDIHPPGDTQKHRAPSHPVCIHRPASEGKERCRRTRIARRPRQAAAGGYRESPAHPPSCTSGRLPPGPSASLHRLPCGHNDPPVLPRPLIFRTRHRAIAGPVRGYPGRLRLVGCLAMFHADRLRPRARQLSLMQERRSTCCSVPPTRCIFRDRARASREVQASQLGSPGGLLPGDDEPAQFS